MRIAQAGGEWSNVAMPRTGDTMSDTLTDAEVDRHVEALNAATTVDTAAERAWLERQLHHGSLTPAQRVRVQAALGDYLRARGEEAPSPAPADTRYY